MKEAPKVNVQGRIIAERDGRAWLAMLPDGEIICGSKREIERSAKRYFKSTANNQRINVGLIEWRG